MEKMSAAMTSGLWFTFRLTQISSPIYAISPLIYFYLAFQISMTVSPDWSARWREMLDMKGVYEKYQTRVQTHCEAIAAYQGAEQEQAIINNQWKEFLNYCIKFVKDASIFTLVTQAFFDYGGHSFAEAMIGRRDVRLVEIGELIESSRILHFPQCAREGVVEKRENAEGEG